VLTATPPNTNPDPDSGTVPSAGGDRLRSALGWISRHTVNVEPGEWRSLLVAWFYFYTLLGAYYMLRPIRETMGIARGADKLPWLMTGTFVVMFFANIAFAWLASRTTRRRFIPLANRFFAVNLLLFFGLLRFTGPEQRVWVGYAFYIWLSIFNLFVISIFWALLGDIFRTGQSRRLFGFVGVGGTLGAITGAGLAEQLIGVLGQPGMLLASAATLELGTWAMILLVHMNRDRFNEARRGGEAAASDTASREPTASVWAGVAMVGRSPYLLLICLYLALYTVSSTFLYMEQGNLVNAQILTDDDRTRFFARVDFWANVLTLLLQAFLTGRLMRWLGVGLAFAILPLVTGLGFGVLWVVPTVGVIFFVQIGRRGLNYAVSRPIRETLFAPLSADEKYKTKPFIDTFIYRGGDVVGSWVDQAFRVVSVAVGWFAIPACALWAVVALIIGVLERRRRQAELASQPD
jgi:AAA family ATP:ADP antiporter